jgi:hypothetical protein
MNGQEIRQALRAGEGLAHNHPMPQLIFKLSHNYTD